MFLSIGLFLICTQQHRMKLDWSPENQDGLIDIKVIVSENNTHSGMGGGVIPNPFNILNVLLMRV